MDLRRRAAEVGPGYRGSRREPATDERSEIAAQMNLAGIEPPAYLTQPADWKNHDAKLFEAGEYPDKGVTITSLHLDQWCQSFDLPVPVLIEHARSPLELGYLTAVRIEDGHLFGTVALTHEADQLIAKSGARALSLGLAPDLASIREVSLVRNPRVASARLFSRTTVGLDGWPWDGALASRLHELERRELDRKVEGYLQAGRLLPCQVAFAKALLTLDQAVVFNEGTTPVGSLVSALIEAARPHRLFAETAPVPTASSTPMEPDAERYFRRHFPGLSLDEIAKRLHPARP